MKTRYSRQDPCVSFAELLLDSIDRHGRVMQESKNSLLWQLLRGEW